MECCRRLARTSRHACLRMRRRQTMPSDPRSQQPRRTNVETRAARASASKPRENLALEDDQASSEPQDFCSQDSEDEDQDIFRDRWAVRRHGKQEGGTKAERLTSLPKKLAKHLQNFESEVLESIPDDINECLGLRTCSSHELCLAVFPCWPCCYGLQCLAQIFSGWTSRNSWAY